MSVYSVTNPSGRRRWGVAYSYYNENGEKKWKRKIIGTKKDAEAEQERIKRGDMLRGIFEDLTQKRIPTMREACDLFYQGYGRELKSQSTITSFLKAYQKKWGDKAINEITRADVNDYAKGLLEKGKALGTVQKSVGTLKFILDWVVQHEGLDFPNPAKEVVKYLSPGIRRKLRAEAKKKRDEIWSEDEIRRLWDAADPYECKILLWAYITTMRKGEIRNMKWEHFDTDKMMLTIPETKTGMPRTLPINDALWGILQELEPKDSGRIFNDVQLFRSKGMQRLQRKAGIEIKKGRGFHKFRHSSATHHIRNGVNPMIVARLGGWEDLNVLMEIYNHYGQENRDKLNAIQAMSSHASQILERSSERPASQPFVIPQELPA